MTIATANTEQVRFDPAAVGFRVEALNRCGACTVQRALTCTEAGTVSSLPRWGRSRRLGMCLRARVEMTSRETAVAGTEVTKATFSCCGNGRAFTTKPTLAPLPCRLDFANR